MFLGKDYRGMAFYNQREGSQNKYVYKRKDWFIKAEVSVQLVKDNICGRNKPNLKFTCSHHLLHHPGT